MVKLTLVVLLLAVLAIVTPYFAIKRNWIGVGDSVIQQVRSPDGQLRAVVTLHRDVGRASRTYYTSIQKVGSPGWAERLWRDRGQHVVLTVDIPPTRLVWLANDRLSVVCEACGLESTAVFRQKYRVGPITIIYQGFPPPYGEIVEEFAYPHIARDGISRVSA